MYLKVWACNAPAAKIARTATTKRPLEKAGPSTLPLRQKGVYLITGGLGHIGLALANGELDPTDGLMETLML